MEVQLSSIYLTLVEDDVFYNLFIINSIVLLIVMKSSVSLLNKFGCSRQVGKDIREGPPMLRNYTQTLRIEM